MRGLGVWGLSLVLNELGLLCYRECMLFVSNELQTCIRKAIYV